MKLRTQRGFTLMELMVVIVIVAILAAVAVPLYINYVRDAQRTEARGAIGAIVTAEQTHFQLNPDGGTQDYINVPLSGFVENPNATPGSQVLNCDLTEALQNWTFRVEGANANGFNAIAEGVAGRPTAGLYVEYQYRRTDPSTWIDQAPGGP
jgi:prepilin-type N-terminal cleavage/methylation domain-containing protein